MDKVGAKNFLEQPTSFIQGGQENSAVFQNADGNGDGALNYNEFEKFVLHVDSKWSIQSVHDLWNKCSHDGVVKYDEFVRWTYADGNAAARAGQADALLEHVEHLWHSHHHHHQQKEITAALEEIGSKKESRLISKADIMGVVGRSNGIYTDTIVELLSRPRFNTESDAVDYKDVLALLFNEDIRISLSGKVHNSMMTKGQHKAHMKLQAFHGLNHWLGLTEPLPGQYPYARMAIAAKLTVTFESDSVKVIVETTFAHPPPPTKSDQENQPRTKDYSVNNSYKDIEIWKEAVNSLPGQAGRLDNNESESFMRHFENVLAKDRELVVLNRLFRVPFVLLDYESSLSEAYYVVVDKVEGMAGDGEPGTITFTLRHKTVTQEHVADRLLEFIHVDQGISYNRRSPTCTWFINESLKQEIKENFDDIWRVAETERLASLEWKQIEDRLNKLAPAKKAVNTKEFENCAKGVYEPFRELQELALAQGQSEEDIANSDPATSFEYTVQPILNQNLIDINNGKRQGRQAQAQAFVECHGIVIQFLRDEGKFQACYDPSSSQRTADSRIYSNFAELNQFLLHHIPEDPLIIQDPGLDEAIKAFKQAQMNSCDRFNKMLDGGLRPIFTIGPGGKERVARSIVKQQSTVTVEFEDSSEPVSLSLPVAELAANYHERVVTSAYQTSSYLQIPLSFTNFGYNFQHPYMEMVANPQKRRKCKFILAHGDFWPYLDALSNLLKSKVAVCNAARHETPGGTTFYLGGGGQEEKLFGSTDYALKYHASGLEFDRDTVRRGDVVLPLQKEDWHGKVTFTPDVDHLSSKNNIDVLAVALFDMRLPAQNSWRPASCKIPLGKFTPGEIDTAYDEIAAIYKSKFASLLQVAKQRELKHIMITGFGSGWFENSPTFVAHMFMQALLLPAFEDLDITIHCVIGNAPGIPAIDNYSAFASTIRSYAHFIEGADSMREVEFNEQLDSKEAYEISKIKVTSQLKSIPLE